MKFYAAARTFNQKGVTIPSQIRYIKYFEQRMRLGPPPSAPVTLSHIILHGPPKGCQEIKLTILGFKDPVTLAPIFHFKRKVKEIIKDQNLNSDKYSSSCMDDGLGKLVIPCDLVVNGDLKFEFEKLLHFWINTWYSQKNTILKKEDIDKAHKDKKCKVFVADFRVELCFDGSESQFLQPVASSPAISTRAAEVIRRPDTNYSTQLAYKWVVNNYRSLLNV